MRRPVILLAVLAVVVGAAVAGWVAGSRISTPEQVAAAAEPPEPSLITVPVERRGISTDVIVRGTVRFDQPEGVTASVYDPTVNAVVTQIPEVGAEILEGDVFYEIAGRPTFALGGDLPLFRDLEPGAEGEDVEQTQRALARLGFAPGPFDGLYGADTQLAVRALYESNGYEPIGATEEELAAVAAARERLVAAQAAHAEALEQRNAATAANNALNDAKANDVAARTELANARARLDEASSGTHPDTGMPPTDAQMAELEQDLQSAEAAAEDATFALDAAQALADSAGPAPSTESTEQAVHLAQRELDIAVAATGDKLPTSEVVFFEVFPIRVDSVAVQRGDIAEGEIMQVSGSRLAIDASVDVVEAELVDVGDTVQIDLTRLGVSLTGTISLKADRPGTEGLSAQEVYIEIIPDEVRPELNNASVRITIPVESTAGDVLAVPVAAVSATAGGGSVVTVVEDDGTTRIVAVTTGLSAGGTVAVVPTNGDLEEGDQVVVGQQ